MNNRTLKSVILILFIVISALGCIKNDIPYPTIYGNFTEFRVDGQLGESRIDATKRTVNIDLADTTDPSHIKLIHYRITDSTVILPEPGSYLDMTKPNYFTLRTYQDYEWAVNAQQIINRKFVIQHQVRKASINPQNYTVLAYVPETTPLNNITIDSLQLGPSNAITTPDFRTVKDFTNAQVFTVKYRNITETWTVNIMPTDQLASTGEADAWGTFAYVKGEIATGTDKMATFEYKKTTENQWTRFDRDVQINGVAISARLTGLEDGTTYQYRAVLGESFGEIKDFTTEKIVTIPNLNFDNWAWDGKNWFANPDATDSYWASGNPGVTSSLAGSKPANTTPEESDVVKGKAAKLLSLGNVTMVGVAAGNLFTGTYKTNAFQPALSVNFGRSYSGARPTKLSGWYKYTSMPIDHPGDHPVGLKNDLGHIYIWLQDANNMQIAYGELVIEKTIATYTKFTIDINYSDSKASPTKLAIIATSSKYGGDFKGLEVTGAVGSGSTLWVDEFELSYD